VIKSLFLLYHIRSTLEMEMGQFDHNESQFLKKIDELNKMGSEAYQAHQDLIRECKLKLGFPETT